MSDIAIMTAQELMRQAGMTANDYMSYAIERIDKQLGVGYARKHPELIGQFMRTAAQDFHTAMMVQCSVRGSQS